MKLPSDDNSVNMNEDGYTSDDYEQLEMMPVPIRDGDFSEYMWMENEEEFNSQVLRQLEEEELMEQCIVAMLDDEDDFQASNNNTRNISNGANFNSRNSNNGTNVNASVNCLTESVNSMSISSNGVRNSSTVSTDEYSDTSNSRPFSVQDRLRRFRPGWPGPNCVELTESEQKSTLNPDAKEFVPLFSSLESTTHSRDQNVPS